MEFLGYAASLAMGIILGVMGGGGSILTVPILVYLFSISPTVATGYSLFVVGLTALIGASMYIKRGDVNFKVGLAFAVPSVIGVNLSRGLIMPAIPEVIFSFPSFALSKEMLIMIVFGALMIAASYSMIRGGPARQALASPASPKISSIATYGLVIGLIAGFVGAGGGFLITPALVLFAGLSMRIAIGTSLMIIAAQSLIGFAGDLSRGAHVDWMLLASVGAIAIVGIIVGSAFAGRVPEKKLKTSFGWFVLFMGAIILIEQANHISLK